LKRSSVKCEHHQTIQIADITDFHQRPQVLYDCTAERFHSPPRLSCVLQSSFNETTRSSLKSARLRQSFEGIIHDVAILRENSLSFVRVEVVRLEIDSRIDSMDSIRGG